MSSIFISRPIDLYFTEFAEAINASMQDAGSVSKRRLLPHRLVSLQCHMRPDYNNYPRPLYRSAWVGFSSQSVCLFVRRITQKRMTLGYPRSGIVLVPPCDLGI